MKIENNIPSSIELEQLTKLYRAMGDLTRMKILWFLMEGELCVSELAYKMDFNESAISHQLKSLRSAHLVKTDLYSIYQAPLHTMSITPLPVLYNIALLKILTFPIFYAPTDIFFC